MMLSIFFHYLITTSFVVNGDSSNSDSGEVFMSEKLPLSWPMDWSSGILPYVINFFSPHSKRLLRLVKTGLHLLENNSCLSFEEQDPEIAAKLKDYTYLYFTYSSVYEDCCLKYYTKDVGRRTVLITPVCSDPHEVAHATLHGLGMKHPKGEGFSKSAADAIMQEWCAVRPIIMRNKISVRVTSKKPTKEALTNRSKGWLGLRGDLRMRPTMSPYHMSKHKRYKGFKKFGFRHNLV